MLYPKSKEKELAPELFRQPSGEYRGMPFWAWNGRLSKEELARQIHIFKKMGLGGFHMHVRTGLETPYLSPEFMDYIRFCIRAAEQEGMLAWLYDEDRWPSGTAGGQVTAGHPENARKTLLFTVSPYEESRPHRNKEPEPGRGQESLRQDNGTLLAVYDVVLDQSGCLRSALRITAETPAKGVKWYAYQEHATADPWFNGQAYADTLRPEAAAQFLQLTHKAYQAAAGEYFGGVVPGIFTDEPQFAPKETLDFPFQQKDLFLSWTDRLPTLYQDRYGEDLLDKLPELLWELPEGRLSPTRWRFQNLLTDLFVQAYCGQVGRWCRENGIMLTGHLMGEPTLESQTQAVGDAMRCYPEFSLPGIDILCDFREYTTAKQAQSVARQNGAEGVLSELYGVTGWNYDFRGYKLQGDWQAALGVTLRVPHLAWLTMKGEAKRDYPASISYQSPWWDQFSMIEDHFARLNTALTRGRAIVSVAVLHPIESYWLHWGPAGQTMEIRRQLEAQFETLAQLLLFGGIDFDYLCEALLPKQCPKGSFPLQVGEAAYQVVLIPPVRTLRKSTLERLEAFQKQGGRVIFLGNCPDHIEGEPSPAAKELYQRAEQLSFDCQAILNALDSHRFFHIYRAGGSREEGLLFQLRQDGSQKWLFLCHGKTPASPDVDPAPLLRLTLRGEYAPEIFDTLTGEILEACPKYENGQTILERAWHMHESLLLRLTPGRSSKKPALPEARPAGPDVLLSPVPAALTEPNMLLLDMAEYSLNGGEFYSEEEVLRIDNLAREKLGLPLRRKEVVQPYLLQPEACPNFLRLRFRIFCESPLSQPCLGLEDPETCQIFLNGKTVSPTPVGWYVDRCIKTVPLPPLTAGENILELQCPIGRRTNLEACYLLGDFGVTVRGCRKTVTSPVKELAWGDMVPQGLPFYTGNVLYRFQVISQGNFTLRVPQYRGALIKVFVDGEDKGNIAFSPYELKIQASAGKHLVQLQLYGTRQNGFAQLHHTQGVYFYQSPNSWRSGGDFWCYEYQFQPAGILKSPELYGAKFLLNEAGESRKSAGTERHISDRS